MYPRQCIGCKYLKYYNSYIGQGREYYCVKEKGARKPLYVIKRCKYGE